MKLVGKVPVEALDEERLTNIERRLVVQVSEMSHRPLRAPRRLIAFASVALAIAVAGVVGFKLRGNGSPAVATNEPERFAMTGGALDLGDAQITGSDLAVERSNERVVVTMRPGKIELHVEHKPGRVFVVKAGDVEIEDVGTRFSVDWQGANVDVRVTEGEVKVKRAGKELSITAGNAWTVELGAVTLAELDHRAAAQTTNEVVTNPPGTNNVVAIAPVGNGGATANGSGAGTSSAAGSGSGQGSGSRHKTGKQDARKALEEAGYEPPLPTSATTPNEALAEYSRKASVMGQDTTRLIYSMAVVQHRAKNNAGALNTLAGVTKRVGADAYQDGMWLVVRIRCGTAFDDECRMAAERYRNSFPSGARTGIADAILREISQQ